eukprot:jgi/Chlat1/3255/Chrsp22S03435
MERCFRPVLKWQPAVREYLAAAYGANKFDRIVHALARPPLETCCRSRVPVEELIPQLSAALEAADSQLQQCENGVAFACDGEKRAVFAHESIPHVVMVGGSGPHHIDYDAHDVYKEIVVSRRCGEAVLRGAQVYVPGVLGCSSSVEAGDLVIVSVEVEAAGGKSIQMTRGTTLGSAHELDSGGRLAAGRLALCLGIGRAQLTRAQIFGSMSGIAVIMERRVFNLPSCSGLLHGKMYVQNLPSIVAAQVLGARPGERVIDMCAAPGGKTTAIAQCMEDKGTLIALDKSHVKAQQIRDLANELGFTCISAYKLDATKAALPPSVADGADAVNGCEVKGFPAHSFDRVLLDAPCSALGLRPRLWVEELSLADLRKFVLYQRKLFESAMKLVRPGGTIVFSTCTLNPGENEGLVRYALDTYPNLTLAAQEPYIGGPGLIGGADVDDGFGGRAWLTEDESRLVQSFDPSNELDTIAFFIAKFHVAE